MRNAWRRSRDEHEPTSPTTVSKWAMAPSYESGMPSACIRGLFGIHTIPPDMQVDPPTSACFSRTSTSAPASAPASAATMPAAPRTGDHEVDGEVPSHVDRYYDIKVNL